MSITEAFIDEDFLEKNNLKLNIRFEVTGKMSKDIHPGIVIYNSMNTPIFGSNTRYHQRVINSGHEKLIIFHVPKLILHTGFYKVSFWIGDHLIDYDYIEHGLVFEFFSNKPYISMPDPLLAGSVDIDCFWEYY